MFPALLAFVALYVTFVAVGDVLPAFGINTSAGLIVAYLGGAMGANVWLLKGYFDTVPRELDEAAKVDGASHARIFFTMTLRLVMAHPGHRVHCSPSWACSVSSCSPASSCATSTHRRSGRALVDDDCDRR